MLLTVYGTHFHHFEVLEHYSLQNLLSSEHLLDIDQLENVLFHAVVAAPLRLPVGGSVRLCSSSCSSSPSSFPSSAVRREVVSGMSITTLWSSAARSCLVNSSELASILLSSSKDSSHCSSSSICCIIAHRLSHASFDVSVTMINRALPSPLRKKFLFFDSTNSSSCCESSSFSQIKRAQTMFQTKILPHLPGSNVLVNDILRANGFTHDALSRQETNAIAQHWSSSAIQISTCFVVTSASQLNKKKKTNDYFDGTSSKQTFGHLSVSLPPSVINIMNTVPPAATSNVISATKKRLFDDPVAAAKEQRQKQKVAQQFIVGDPLPPLQVELRFNVSSCCFTRFKEEDDTSSCSDEDDNDNSPGGHDAEKNQQQQRNNKRNKIPNKKKPYSLRSFPYSSISLDVIKAGSSASSLSSGQQHRQLPLLFGAPTTIPIVRDGTHFSERGKIVVVFRGLRPARAGTYVLCARAVPSETFTGVVSDVVELLPPFTVSTGPLEQIENL